MAKPNVICLLGPPGSGKGTLCSRIVNSFGGLVQHLCVGDTLKEEMTSQDSPYAQTIREYIQRSEIVPVDITLHLIWKAMLTSQAKIILLDGFPRDHNNMIGWKNSLAPKVNLLVVFSLECNYETCIERCRKRSASGKRREDDVLDVLKRRIQDHENYTIPIIEEFEKLNLVKKLDTNLIKEQVFPTAEKYIQDFINMI